MLLKEVSLCVQKLPWHAQIASNVTTTPPRKKRITPTVWKSKNTAGFATSTPATGKLSSGLSKS